MSTQPTKKELFTRGCDLGALFCKLNKMVLPVVNVRTPDSWPFNACAFYRMGQIFICLDKCAAIGVAGPAWSYPGNTVDRTPFGVIAHELGHHADIVMSTTYRSGDDTPRHRDYSYRGNYSEGVRAESKEEELTKYCPNDGEWFAEMFRLFVTNPDLLRLIRPRTYSIISRHFQPAVKGSWIAVLQDAPTRTKTACLKKIGEAALKKEI